MRRRKEEEQARSESVRRREGRRSIVNLPSSSIFRENVMFVMRRESDGVGRTCPIFIRRNLKTMGAYLHDRHQCSLLFRPSEETKVLAPLLNR